MSTTVTGIELAGMLLTSLREHVAVMSPEAQAAIEKHIQMARGVIALSKMNDNAAPLIAMLLVSLETLIEDDAPAGSLQ